MKTQNMILWGLIIGGGLYYLSTMQASAAPAPQPLPGPGPGNGARPIGYGGGSQGGNAGSYSYGAPSYADSMSDTGGSYYSQTAGGPNGMGAYPRGW